MRQTPSIHGTSGSSPALAEEELSLLASLRAGDARAFEVLVRQNTGRMLAVAKRLLSNEEDAMDAVQEAFLSAYKAMGSFQGGSRLSTWLHRITVNAALMRLRKRGRKSEVAIEDLLPKFSDDGHQASPAVQWRDSASMPLEAEETKRLVRRAIDQLPDIYRTVLLLRDIEELDTEETARMLDMNLNTVKVRLHRARQALRALLDPAMQGEN